jgi:hypothetical protein
MVKLRTAAEFERHFCKTFFGAPVETFRRLGWRIVPCHCGNEDCSGWTPANPALIQAWALRDIADCSERLSDLLVKSCELAFNLYTKNNPLEADGILRAVEAYLANRKKKSDPVQ